MYHKGTPSLVTFQNVTMKNFKGVFSLVKAFRQMLLALAHRTEEQDGSDVQSGAPGSLGLPTIVH